MKLKQQLIGFVFILFIMLAIAFFVDRSEKQQRYEKKSEQANKMFPDITAETAGDQVAQIEIIANAETTVLRKSGTQWLVASMDDYPADQEGIKTLLEKVDQQKVLDLVSKNPEKQADFEVDASGVEAKFQDENQKLLAHFFVGKNTPDFFNTYIRRDGSQKVYIGKDLSQSNFDKGTRSWRNRKVFDFNKGDITHLLIELASEVVELKMGDDSKWQMLQPEASAVKQTTLDTILNNISSYETDDFVEADAENPFEGKEKITVTLNDGSTRVLMAAEEKDGKHQVKPLDQDQIFSVYKYKYNQLFKPSADLKDDTPPPSGDENSNESENTDGNGDGQMGKSVNP